MDKTLATALSRFLDVWMREVRKNLAKEIGEFTREATESFRKQLFELMRGYTSDLEEAFAEIRLSLEADAETIGPLLSQANFWITPSTTLYLWQGLKQLIARGEVTPEEVKQLFISYYEAGEWYQLKEMVSSWEDDPYFINRMPIIQDALDAHLRGNYTLTIPTLLCQVEGILSSIFERPAGSPTIMIKDAITDRHTEFLRAASKDILIKFVTSPVGFGRTKPQYFTSEKFPEWLQSKGHMESDSLNRHAILHGVQINYASKENSLRIFLLLDVLHLMGRQE